MSDAQPRLTLLVSQGQRQLVINADIPFRVEERAEIPEVHISDVIYSLILQRMKEQAGTTLLPGDYRIALTLVVSDLTEAVSLEPSVVP